MNHQEVDPEVVEQWNRWFLAAIGELLLSWLYLATAAVVLSFIFELTVL